MSDSTVCQINAELFLLPYSESVIPTFEGIAQLSESERNRFHRCVSKRKVEFLLGRTLLRTLIRKRLNLEPSANIDVEEQDAMPPHVPVANENSIYFNISHSDNLIGIVITQTRIEAFNIGLDVEWINSVADFSTSTFFCNQRQQDQLDNEDCMSRKTDLYFQFWTKKEAYFKSTQTGITDHNLKKLDFISSHHNKNLYSALLDIGEPNRSYRVAVYGSHQYSLSSYHVSMCNSSLLSDANYIRITPDWNFCGTVFSD